MGSVPESQILLKFINNTIYQSEQIVSVIHIAMRMASIEEDKMPLTVVSSFCNVPDKLGYYYTPDQLRRDKDAGNFPMGDEQFERAKYGVVRLRLDYTTDAKRFLKAAIHEYIHAVQYMVEPDVMRIIGEDPVIVAAKEAVAYDASQKLTQLACKANRVIVAIENLDNSLGWL